MLLLGESSGLNVVHVGVLKWCTVSAGMADEADGLTLDEEAARRV
jgi:hypothetical protein